MPPVPSEDIMRKRLGTMTSTQESVQTCSKWVLHHRESIDKVANCWMEIYKTANDKLRTALVYLLNDVVQKAAARRDVNVTLTFHPHLINATTISSLAVKKAISRCVEVFGERKIYPPHIIDEMKSALVSSISVEKKEASSGDESQNPGEIDFPQLIRGIESFYKNEMLTEKAREILSRSSFNFKESVQARVKDREEGVKALADMDASKKKLVSFLESVERHQQKGMKLLHTMRLAQNAFNLQLRDVTVVNDAYEKFFEGIRETRQQLADIACNDLPTREAASSQQTANESRNDGEELAGGGDDMEMDEEDKPGTSSQCFLKPSKDYMAQITLAGIQQQHVGGGGGSIDMDLRNKRIAGGLTHQFGAPQLQTNGATGQPAPLVMDPRQARFFQQQPPPSSSSTIPTSQIPMPPPSQMEMEMNAIPPPGLSPVHQQPQLNIAEGGGGGNNTNLVDTSQPPPQFFNVPPPTIANGAGAGDVASRLTSLFNLPMMNSPPPGMFNPSQTNFAIPPPGLVNPAPMFSPQQQQQRFHAGGYGGGPGQLDGGAKRRNSSATESEGFRPKRGRNDGAWSGEEPRRGGWRRSFAGGDARRYRH